MDRAGVFRWVRKFGPEIARCACDHPSRRGLAWHVDETCIPYRGAMAISVARGGPGRPVHRFPADGETGRESGQAFLKQAVDGLRLYRQASIHTDKAPGYRNVVQDPNRRYDEHFDSIVHIDRRWRNKRTDGDHATLKRLLGTRQSFRSMRSARALIMAMATIRTIKTGCVSNRVAGVRGWIDPVRTLFREAA